MKTIETRDDWSPAAHAVAVGMVSSIIVDNQTCFGGKAYPDLDSLRQA